MKDAYVDGRLELAAPLNIIYAAGNSILKNSQLTEKDAAEVITSLLNMDLLLLTPTLQRVNRAMEIAKLKKTTLYCASCLQAAEELKTTLLSADEKQIVTGREIINTLHLREARL